MAAQLSVVVLISGGGSNLQALIDGAVNGSLDIELRAVISNKADAFGLERARAAGIPAVALDHRVFADRESYEVELRRLIDAFEPGLVVLAGYMRILTPGTVRHYLGRMFNIHPSLLPAFPGLHTHARAIEAGHAEHGASVHFVTEELDGGPVVLQAKVPVRPEDDAETLAARVLEQEHRIYPLAVAWFAAGRLQLGESGPLMDGEAMTSHPVISASTTIGPDGSLAD